jgi:hypothetical protein
MRNKLCLFKFASKLDETKPQNFDTNIQSSSKEWMHQYFLLAYIFSSIIS